MKENPTLDELSEWIEETEMQRVRLIRRREEGRYPPDWDVPRIERAIAQVEAHLVKLFSLRENTENHS